MTIILSDLAPNITYPILINGVPVFVGPFTTPLSILNTDTGSADFTSLFTVASGTITFTDQSVVHPPGVTFNAGIYSWSGSQVAGTSYNMTVRATGSNAPLQPTDFNWVLNVNAAGGPPSFSGPIPNQTFTVSTGTQTFDASGYATGQTSYTLTGVLPAGITFNNSTGVFTINTNILAVGTYPLGGAFKVNYINGFGSVSSGNFNIIIAAPASGRIYIPGIYVAISYPQRGVGGGDSLSNDSGSFSYHAGSVAIGSLTITGNYGANIGSIPGGSTGGGTSSGCNDGTGSGGHTLSRNLTGPCVDFENIGTPKITGARTQALVVRYPWNDIELSKNSYYFDQMDADLAQCIALDVLFFPVIVQKTFGNTEANGGTFTDPQGVAGNGDCVPAYLSNFRSAGQGNQGATVWRWDETNIKPRMIALITAIGNRYDLCTHFGGMCTQETATAGADGLGATSGWVTQGTSPNNGDKVVNYPISYYNCLKAEVDACFAANPSGRQLIFQNFAGSPAPGDRMLEDYAAYAVTKGAILAGPDLVTGGSVYDRCYTSGNALKGRYYAYHHGGSLKLASGSQFPAVSGPTGCSIQRAEWIGLGPSYKGASPSVLTWTVQNTFDYGVNAVNDTSAVAQKLNSGVGNPIPAINPDYLNLDIVIIDWHQEGTGTAQQFADRTSPVVPGGVSLIKNNPSPFGSWVP